MEGLIEKTWNEEELEAAAEAGILRQYLQKWVPREDWNCEMLKMSIDTNGKNTDAMIIMLKQGVNPDEEMNYLRHDGETDTCAYYCLVVGSFKQVEVLLTSGCCTFYWPDDDDIDDEVPMSPLECLNIYGYNDDRDILLLSNGYSHPKMRNFGPDEQKARIAYVWCRKVIVTLLALKRRRIRRMIYIDRFLVRELALCMYTTRTERAWTFNDVCQAELKRCAHNGTLVDYVIHDLKQYAWNSRTEKNRTILHYACASEEYEELVSMLIGHVNVNVESISGTTAIKNAFLYGNVNMVRMLCEANVNIEYFAQKTFFENENEISFEFKEKMRVIYDHYQRRKKCFLACRTMSGIIRRTKLCALNGIVYSMWATRSNEMWNLQQMTNRTHGLYAR